MAAAKSWACCERFECLGKQGRLVIQGDDGKLTRVAVRDPGQIGITRGEKMVSCGVQKPARRVAVQYVAQPDKKLGTVGNATTIEFR